MSLRASYKKIIVACQPYTTAGGIELPESAITAEHQRQAIVHSVGPGVHTDLDVGDRILLTKGGLDIRYDGQDFKAIEDPNILAVIECQ